MNTRRRLLVRIPLAGMALAAVVAVCWVVAHNHPATSRVGQYLPKCLLYSATGLHCPGCGLTRSAHAWLNGDWEQGLAYHALSFVALPLVGWYLLRGLWGWVWADPAVPPPPRKVFPRWLARTLVTVLVVFSVVRNVPYHPFRLLAPHEVSRPVAEEEPGPAE